MPICTLANFWEDLLGCCCLFRQLHHCCIAVIFQLALPILATRHPQGPCSLPRDTSAMAPRKQQGESFSETFKRASNLARWTSGFHKAGEAVDAFADAKRQNERRKSDENFLAKLRAAEARDEASLGQTCASSQDHLAASAVRAPIVPLGRKQPGPDTAREIETAQREAKLIEREAAMVARHSFSVGAPAAAVCASAVWRNCAIEPLRATVRRRRSD